MKQAVLCIERYIEKKPFTLKRKSKCAKAYRALSTAEQTYVGTLV
ncbi:MAG: hypothetical protein WCE21_05340 [Candidatus Babeliales bacterium]